MKTNFCAVVSILGAALLCGCDTPKGGTPTAAGTPVAGVLPPPAPLEQPAFPQTRLATSTEVKRQLRARWEADFPTVQERINDRIRDRQIRGECQQRLDRLKTLIAEFAQRDLQPDDLTVVVALGRDVESLKREVGFFVSNTDFSNMSSLSAMPSMYSPDSATRDPRLPDVCHEGGWTHLDNELHGYAVCLVNYPELKETVVRDIAELLFRRYEPELLKHPEAGYGRATLIASPGFRPIPFFARHVPGQPLNLENKTVAEFPADAMRRAKALDPTASEFHLRRLVWAEWLLENRGLKPYREFVWGEGKDKTGKPYSYQSPDRSRPTLAALMSEVHWGHVRDTAK